MDARSHRFALLAITIFSLFTASTPAATIGPLPYNDLLDSPFDLSRRGIDFFVEDFSQGLRWSIRRSTFELAYPDPLARLFTPGAYVTGSFDHRHQGDLLAFGHWTDIANRTTAVDLLFEFDINELGQLPQAVGFRISNAAPITANFYGADGTLLDSLFAPAIPLPTEVPPFSSPTERLEFYSIRRFLGAIHRDGISWVTISASGVVGLRIDDFQYGQLAPEPATAVLALFAVVALLSQGRSRFPGSFTDLHALISLLTAHSSPPQTKPAALVHPCTVGGW